MKLFLSRAFMLTLVSPAALALNNNNNNPLAPRQTTTFVTSNNSKDSSTGSAKAKYVRNLRRKSKLLRAGGRRLENDNNNNNNYNNYNDLSSYSVKFQQCQFVRSFDDDMAADEDSPTVLGTTRFAIFRLCPDNDCDNCSSYGYGEYIIDMGNYLELSIQYFEEKQQEMCNDCAQYCYDGQEVQEYNDEDRQRHRVLGNNGVNPDYDCSECESECQHIQNMEQNGYVDALEFMYCVKIYDDGQENGIEYYAAPVCANSGAKIKIGVFSDKYCTVYEYGKDVEDYLEPDADNGGKPMKLSNVILKKTYQNTCISCSDDNGQASDFCQNLYYEAAKCESMHGFENPYTSMNANNNNNGGQQQQVNSQGQEHEDTVCAYINSIEAGTYDEYGEIAISGKSYSFFGGNKPTTTQRVALAFFICGTVALAVYAAIIHAKLVRRHKRRHHHHDDTM